MIITIPVPDMVRLCTCYVAIGYNSDFDVFHDQDLEWSRLDPNGCMIDHSREWTLQSIITEGDISCGGWQRAICSITVCLYYLWRGRRGATAKPSKTPTTKGTAFRQFWFWVWQISGHCRIAWCLACKDWSRSSLFGITISCDMQMQYNLMRW